MSKIVRADDLAWLAFHLPLLNPVEQLDAMPNHACAVAILEPGHGPDSAFDGSLVLLENGVQVLVLTNLDGSLALDIDRVKHSQIRAAPINGHRPR